MIATTAKMRPAITTPVALQNAEGGKRNRQRRQDVAERHRRRGSPQAQDRPRRRNTRRAVSSNSSFSGEAGARRAAARAGAARRSLRSPSSASIGWRSLRQPGLQADRHLRGQHDQRSTENGRGARRRRQDVRRRRSASMRRRRDRHGGEDIANGYLACRVVGKLAQDGRETASWRFRPLLPRSRTRLRAFRRSSVPCTGSAGCEVTPAK